MNGHLSRCGDADMNGHLSRCGDARGWIGERRMTDAVRPEARGDDDPADIRRLAPGTRTPARQEEEVVRSWLILRSEGAVTGIPGRPQSEAGAFSNRCFGSHTGHPS